MASLFGSVATEVGGTMKDLGQQKREERLADDEAMREMQLQKQRMHHDSGLVDRRISADDRREERRQEYDTMQYDAETERRMSELEYGEGAAMEREQLKSDTDRFVAGLAAFTAEQKDGRAKGGGWTTFQQQDLAPDGSGFITSLYATHEGFTYRQIGDKFVDAGMPGEPQIYDFGGDTGKQREAEGDLYGGRMTATEFKDAFGYVPGAYITSRVTSDNNAAREYMRGLGIDVNRGGDAGGPGAARFEPVTGSQRNMIDQAAEQHGLPVALIEAVGFVESGGVEDRSNATSSAGARGFMQLMPATAEELGVTDITDDRQNIPAGAAYLSQMMRKYNGDVSKALAAYNAGPSRVDEAIAAGGNWIDNLPPETRNYLPKALGRYYTLSQGQEGVAPAVEPAAEAGALSEGAAAEGEAPPAVTGAPGAIEPGSEQALQATHGDLTDDDAEEIARLISTMETQLQRGRETAERAEQTAYPQDPLGAFKETGDLIMDWLKVEHPTVPPEELQRMQERLLQQSEQ